MSEREAFEEWVKKEHPHIYSGSLKDNEDSVRFKMDVDFMFSAWQASAKREGYKLVPVEPSKDMLNSGYRVKHDKIIDLGNVYKAMIGACDEP